MKQTEVKLKWFEKKLCVGLPCK